MGWINGDVCIFVHKKYILCVLCASSDIYIAIDGYLEESTYFTRVISPFLFILLPLRLPTRASCRVVFLS
jgi:hypothetical protein